MGRHTSIAIRMALVTIIVFGVIYPFLITGLAQLFFHKQANGSIISEHGKVIGSELIGQQFAKPEYFHPRPSAAGNGYDATSSGASNLGPTSRRLINEIKGRTKTAMEEDLALRPGRIPIDMVTASASGLDPDISVANAYVQIPRIAEARGISDKNVRTLVKHNITRRQWGFLGEPRVNVLQINRALDKVNRATK